MTIEKKKEKIALACPSFSGGGAERVMITLANKFSESGYDVDFIVGKDYGPYRRMLSEQINKVVLFDQNKNKIQKFIGGAKVIREYCRIEKPNVLMSTVREFNVFVYFSLAFLSCRPKLALREAAAFDVSHVKGSFKARVLNVLMWFSYNNADKVISNSKATTNDLVHYLGLKPKNVVDIYNPLNLSELETNGQDCGSNVVVLGVGRLVKNKNFEDLIRVIPIIKKNYPSVALKILGEGKEESELKRLTENLGVEDNVELLGFVDNPYSYYREANVFVQTSLWEGFGYVLVEAMACGTPVVAYDSKGAMREILENGKYGKLTPVGDIEALSKAVIEQIENPTPPELLEEAVQRFDVNVIAKQYLQALGVEHV